MAQAEKDGKEQDQEGIFDLSSFFDRLLGNTINVLDESGDSVTSTGGQIKMVKSKSKNHNIKKWICK
jgi:hypothetical protein